MSNPTPNRPLWEVMHDAYLTPTLSGPRGHLGFAAELRAIVQHCSYKDEWGTRLIKAQELLDEADRAEAGE